MAILEEACPLTDTSVYQAWASIGGLPSLNGKGSDSVIVGVSPNVSTVSNILDYAATLVTMDWQIRSSFVLGMLPT